MESFWCFKLEGWVRFTCKHDVIHGRAVAATSGSRLWRIMKWAPWKEWIPLFIGPSAFRRVIQWWEYDWSNFVSENTWPGWSVLEEVLVASTSRVKMSRDCGLNVLKSTHLTLLVSSFYLSASFTANFPRPWTILRVGCILFLSVPIVEGLFLVFFLLSD